MKQQIQQLRDAVWKRVLGEDAAPRPDWLPDTGPSQLSIPPEKWALTVKHWKDLFRAMRTTPRYKRLQQRKKPISMYDLMDHFVIPWTRNTGCSLALLLNPEGLDAELMASHAWAEDNTELEEAVEEHFRRAKLSDDVHYFFVLLPCTSPRRCTVMMWARPSTSSYSMTPLGG